MLHSHRRTPTRRTDTCSSRLSLSHSYSICSSLTQTHLKAQIFLNQYCYSLNVSNPISLVPCPHQHACVQPLSEAASMFSSFAFAHAALFPSTALPLVRQKVCRPVVDLCFLVDPKSERKEELMRKQEVFLPLRALLAGRLHCQCLC